MTAEVNAQSVDRERPAGWESLIFGGRFKDRFLPMPVSGELSSNTWGQKMWSPVILIMIGLSVLPGN